METISSIQSVGQNPKEKLQEKKKKEKLTSLILLIGEFYGGTKTYPLKQALANMESGSGDSRLEQPSWLD